MSFGTGIVFITGGARFIGPHLAAALKAKVHLAELDECRTTADADSALGRVVRGGPADRAVTASGGVSPQGHLPWEAFPHYLWFER